MTVASGDLARPGWLERARGRAGRLSLAHVVGLVCVVLAMWLVLVPLGALFYTAFAEDTPYGPGAFTLENFANAYSSAHLPRLMLNSFIFASGSSTTSLSSFTYIPHYPPPLLYNPPVMEGRKDDGKVTHIIHT